jgi:hypothetical protein
MHSIYPDAKLIYIVRDGRDVLISERFRNFVEESKFLSREDKRIVEGLSKDQSQFTNGTRSIFTETFIRRVAKGWAQNLLETEDEGQRLFGEGYFSLRYEDLLASPFIEMTKVWRFLGVKEIMGTLVEQVRTEMASNPDEEWQSKRNEGIASFLPKGQAGNWQRLFTDRDKSLFKEVAGDMLIKWNYEKDLNW